MGFKDLVLDRNLISQAIFQYDHKLHVEHDEVKSTFTAFYDGQAKAVLKFHFRNNGKTTIQTNQCKNTELAERIAKHVVEQCQVAVFANSNFRVSPLTPESFELLLEYLTEECEATHEEKVIAGGKQYLVNGIQGDKVSLSYYKNGTFLIQGCPVLLFTQIIDFLCEYLDLRTLVESQLNLIDTGVTVDDALAALEAELPNAYANLDERLKAVLSPSLVLRKLDLELTDYSALTFPALKGLEGYIKSLFSRKGITIDNAGFSQYLRNDSHRTLNSEARALISCEATCTSINRCYGYYSQQRHGIFHASGVIRSTRLVQTREEAVAIINNVMEVIEKSEIELMKIQ